MDVGEVIFTPLRQWLAHGEVTIKHPPKSNLISHLATCAGTPMRLQLRYWMCVPMESNAFEISHDVKSMWKSLSSTLGAASSASILASSRLMSWSSAVSVPRLGSPPQWPSCSRLRS